MTNGTNASITITKLRDNFAVFGLPDEYRAFCQANGIKPVKAPPYHRQSNGAAEQTVKKRLEKALLRQKIVIRSKQTKSTIFEALIHLSRRHSFWENS